MIGEISVVLCGSLNTFDLLLNLHWRSRTNTALPPYNSAARTSWRFSIYVPRWCPVPQQKQSFQSDKQNRNASAEIFTHTCKLNEEPLWREQTDLSNYANSWQSECSSSTAYCITILLYINTAEHTIIQRCLSNQRPVPTTELPCKWPSNSRCRRIMQQHAVCILILFFTLSTTSYRITNCQDKRTKYTTARALLTDMNGRK